MKKYVFLLIIVVILQLFALNCSAEGEVDEYISDFESCVPKDLSDLVGDTDKLVEMTSFRALLDELGSVIISGGGEVVGFFLKLVGCTLLMSLAGLCMEKFSTQVSAAVGVICSLLVYDSLGPLFSKVEESLLSLADFFAALIPITVGITALGGATSSAAVQGTGMYTVLSLVGGVGTRLFFAVSSFGLAMSLLSALGHRGVSAISRGVKELFGRITGICTALLTAAISMQTVIASAADTAALRAAKYATSGLIPIVGGAVAGAISTLTAAMSYAKGIVGGGAVAVIVYLALSPLALLLLYRLALSVVIILSEFIGAPPASGLFTSFRFALDMTLTVYTLSALIYLFMIVIFIWIGGSI